MNEKMDKNKQMEMMEQAPVNQAILKMSLPVVAGMMVQVLYNLVDTFFIGRLEDADQLAASGVTAPVFMMLMAVATIVSTGAASYISRNLGAGDKEKASRTLSTGYAICIALAIVIMALGIPFLSSLTTILGAEEAVYPYAWKYTFTILIGSLPIMLSYTAGQLIRAEGAAMDSVKGMMAGTITNVILDPVFIFGFKMGITGAGIATVLANVMALFVHLSFYRKKSVLTLSVKNVSFEKDIYVQIFAIGVPAALSQMLISVAMVICNNLLSLYEDAKMILAGLGVVSRLNYIGTFIFMGFGAGCQPLIGYNYGAGNWDRTKKIIRHAMMITLTIGIALFAVFGLAAPFLIRLMSPIAEVVAQGTKILRIQMFIFLCLGPQMISSVSLQAFGKALSSLILSVARQGLFFIPLLFLGNRLFGVTGILAAQPIADFCTLILGMLLLWRVERNFKEEEEDGTEAIA